MNVPTHSGYKVEHQCPQCGAPVTLEEADRFFECRFCRVRSYIYQKSFFRYMFKPSERTPKDRNIIYIPYWRFKGSQFTCSIEKGVRHQFMDMSRLAIPEEIGPFPMSLGLRSQALPLKLVSGDTTGTFIAPLGFKKALALMEAMLTAIKPKEPAVLRQYIGEARTLIFSPFYIEENRVFDAILNKPAGHAGPEILNAEKLGAFRPDQGTAFIAGICPSCGWDLHGSSDSLVLVCKNCDSMWRPKKDELVRVEFACAQTEPGDYIYMPFWCINADISGIPFCSYADLARIANLPRAILPEWENRKISFWAPAFKINPEIFLRLSRQFTVFQPSPKLSRKIHGLELHPVTLPPREGLESIKIVMAVLVKPARKWLPLLPETKVTPKKVRLVYMPFEKRHHDFFSPEMRISIAKNSLTAGTNL